MGSPGDGRMVAPRDRCAVAVLSLAVAALTHWSSGLRISILSVPETRSGARWASLEFASGHAAGEWARRSWRLGGWVGRGRGGSGGVAVLVDESAARGVSSDRLGGPILDDFGVVGCSLAERPVGAVGVVVLDVVA